MGFNEYINNNVTITAKGDFNIIPNKIVVKKGDSEEVVYDKANNIDKRNTYTFTGVKDGEELIEYEVIFTYEKSIVDYNYKIKNTNNTQDIVNIQPSEKTIKISEETLSFNKYIEDNLDIRAKGDFEVIPNKIVVKHGDTEDVVFDKANNIDHRENYTFTGAEEGQELTAYEILFTYEKKETFCKVKLKVDSDNDSGYITINDTGAKVKEAEFNANPNESFESLWDRAFDFEPEEGYMVYMIKRRKEEGQDDTIYEHQYINKEPEVDRTDEYLIDTDMTFEILFSEKKEATVMLNLKKGKNNDDSHITKLEQKNPIPYGMTLFDAMDGDYIVDDYEKNGQEYLYRLSRIISKKGGAENVLFDYVKNIEKRDKYTLVEDNEEIIFESMGIEKEIKIELLNTHGTDALVNFKETADPTQSTMIKRVNIHDTDYDVKNMSYTDLLRSYQYNSYEPIVWDNIEFSSFYGGEKKIKLKRISFVEDGKAPQEGDYIFDFNNDNTVNKLGEIIKFPNASKLVMQIEFEIRDDVVLTFNANDNSSKPIFNVSHNIVDSNISNVLRDRMDNYMEYRGERCAFLTTKNCISFTDTGDIDIRDIIFGKLMEGIGRQFRNTSSNYKDARELVQVKESQDYYANYQVWEKSGETSSVKYPVIFNLVYKNSTGKFFDRKTLVCYVNENTSYLSLTKGIPTALNIPELENPATFKGLYEFNVAADEMCKLPMVGVSDYTKLDSLNTYTWTNARNIDILYT